MKATIDGITCDGTPEEINEFKKLRDALNEQEAWKLLEKATLRTHPNTKGESNDN